MNLIRGIHGLSPVSYSVNDDANTLKLALMSTANNSLGQPDASWQCYDGAGAAIYPQTVDYSLLFNDGSLVIPPTDALAYFLISSNVTFGGAYDAIYRQAILNPFLIGISYGR